MPFNNSVMSLAPAVTQLKEPVKFLANLACINWTKMFLVNNLLFLNY